MHIHLHLEAILMQVKNTRLNGTSNKHEAALEVLIIVLVPLSPAIKALPKTRRFPETKFKSKQISTVLFAPLVVIPRHKLLLSFASGVVLIAILGIVLSLVA